MEVHLDQLATWILGFLWPFVRIAAMFSAAPLISARTLPMRVRLVLAVTVTAVVAPLAGPVPQLDALSPIGVLVIVNQILIGFAMGLALQVGFAVLAVGGQLVGASMGLGFASVVDPQNGVQMPVISQLYFLLGALLFLTLDGHLMIVELVARSFVTLPLDTRSITPEQLQGLALWSGLVFSEGLRLAMPVILVTLLLNLALGVATRTAPQLNVFSLGFSITLLLGLSTMLLTLGYLVPLFTGVLHRAFEMASTLVAA